MKCFKKILKFSDQINFSENKFKESAVLVPFLKINEEENILFEIRAANVTQPGEICFPGGKRNFSDVSLRQTAVRETHEELGLSESEIVQVSPLGCLQSSFGKSIFIFTGEFNIKYPESLRINKEEVEKVFVLPAEYFLSTEPEIYSVHSFISPEKDGIVTFPSKELNLPEKYHQNWGYEEKKILVYRTEYGIIWGITAQILYDIFRMIK